MKITFNSPAILGFSFLCVVVYVLTAFIGIGNNLFILPPTFDFYNYTSYLKLFSYVFGHATTDLNGDISADHIIGNLSFILLLGPIIEEKYGTKHTIIILITTALVTAICNILFFNSGLMGASGIVFALIVLSSLVNFKNKEIPITFILVVIIYIGREVISSFDQDNVSQFAHIIGGIIGAFFGFKFQKKKKTAIQNPIDILKGLK